MSLPVATALEPHHFYLVTMVGWLAMCVTAALVARLVFVMWVSVDVYVQPYSKLLVWRRLLTSTLSVLWWLVGKWWQLLARFCISRWEWQENGTTWHVYTLGDAAVAVEKAYSYPGVATYFNAPNPRRNGAQDKYKLVFNGTQMRQTNTLTWFPRNVRSRIVLPGYTVAVIACAAVWTIVTADASPLSDLLCRRLASRLPESLSSVSAAVAAGQTLPLRAYSNVFGVQSVLLWYAAGAAKQRDGNAPYVTASRAVIQGFVLLWGIWALLPTVAALQLVVALATSGRVCALAVLVVLFDVTCICWAICGPYLSAMVLMITWRGLATSVLVGATAIMAGYWGWLGRTASKILGRPVYNDEPRLEKIVEGWGYFGTAHEFWKVKDLFHDTCDAEDFEVVSIEKVHNTFLECSYQQYATNVSEHADQQEYEYEQKKLFHGSNRTTLETIVTSRTKPFDRSYNEVGALGKGSYFARDASYSAATRYSTPDGENVQHVCLVDVVVGQSTRGHEGMNGPGDYMVAVDSVATPTIFVVFDDNGACPRYIISFKRK